MSLPSQYDGFLYSTLPGSSGGGSASVLSVLARMDIDPWEEAARLASLSRPEATKSLASSLNQWATRQGQPGETESVATRLVMLLPAAAASTTGNAPDKKVGQPQLASNFWLMWLCIQVVLFTLVSFQSKTNVDGGKNTAASPSAEKASNGTALTTKKPSPAMSNPVAPKSVAPTTALPEESPEDP